MYHPICGFEHLHRHTGYSILDGFATVEEYAERMREINQKYLCITDHGVMGAIPDQIRSCEKHNLFPMFGIEMYVNRMQPEAANREESKEFRKNLSDEDKVKFDKSHHLLAIAYNNVGYSNLVQLSSWAWIHGFYRKPRVNHDMLRKHREGIVFTSSCAISEIAYAFFAGGDEAGFQMLEYYLEMLGRENFYLELMMLDFKLQKPYDAFLLRAHEKYGLPIILTQDCHVCKKEHSLNQRLSLMQQNHRTIHEINALIESGEGEGLFELQDENLYQKSEEELNEKWELDYSGIIDYELFKIAKSNTVKICEMARGVELDRTLKLPQFPNDSEILMEEVKKGFKLRHLPNTDVYWKRIQEEYELLCEKEYCSYFLLQKEMLDEARRASPEIIGFGDGTEAVGPGRGSLCGSLIAYCIRLHDVEPIRHGLKFSRFLSRARGGKQMKTKHTIDPISIDELEGMI